MKDLEAVKKLDEAIQALEEAGYEFRYISLVDRSVTSLSKEYAERMISIVCHKYFPVEVTEEVAKIRKLASFSRGQTC